MGIIMLNRRNQAASLSKQLKSCASLHLYIFPVIFLLKPSVLALSAFPKGVLLAESDTPTVSDLLLF